jgi:8-oxo-dGTP diphosphatase
MPNQNTILESVAKILVINDKSEILVLTLGKHLKYPEKSYRPDLPGGVVDSGESEQLAVIREVQEECGIDLDASKIKLAYSETAYYEKENKSVTKLLYITHLDDTPSIILSWEHSDYKWVSTNELQTIDLRPFFNEAIQYFITNKVI